MSRRSFLPSSHRTSVMSIVGEDRHAFNVSTVSVQRLFQICDEVARILDSGGEPQQIHRAWRAGAS